MIAREIFTSHFSIHQPCKLSSVITAPEGRIKGFFNPFKYTLPLREAVPSKRTSPSIFNSSKLIRSGMMGKLF